MNLISRKARPNVVIHCDVFGTGRRGAGPASFIPRVRIAYGKEPGGRFIVENHNGIPVWIDGWLLSQVSPDESFSIGLNRGLIKTLKVELVSSQQKIKKLA
jgi:hypothetical protein